MKYLIASSVFTSVLSVLVSEASFAGYEGTAIEYYPANRDMQSLCFSEKNNAKMLWKMRDKWAGMRYYIVKGGISDDVIAHTYEWDRHDGRVCEWETITGKNSESEQEMIGILGDTICEDGSCYALYMSEGDIIRKSLYGGESVNLTDGYTRVR